MSGRISYFEGKNLAVFSKMHYACIEVFSVILIQFSLDFEYIRPSAKYFWYDWQKLHSIAPGFCWRTKVFFWKSSFLCLFCSLREKRLHTTHLDVSAVSLNLHFTCPEERFGRKISVKKTSLNFCSDFEQNVSRL